MNTNKLALTAALMLTPFLLANGAAAPIPETPNERAVIALQSKAFMDGLQRGDAHAAAAQFTADAKLIVSGSAGIIAGRGAIESFLQSALSNGVKELRLTTIEVEGEGALQIETGTYAALGAGGSNLGSGHYLFVWKKEGGVWKIHRDIGVAAPAPTADRVGLSRDYRSTLKLLDATVQEKEPSVMTVFGNELATAVVEGADQIQYPYGTVIAMEFAHGVRDGEGQLVYDADGSVRRSEVAHIDVMRREKGYGAVYGENRAGEWEFASYRPDGSVLLAAENASACAGCHRNAGPERDFVFRKHTPAVRR